MGPELLRIFAMIMIIAHHLVCFSGIEYDTVCFYSVFLAVMKMGGKIGVNCFLLISGFYLIESKTTVKKALMLMCQTVFYSFLFYGIVCFCGVYPLSLKNLMFAFLPFVSTRGNWFITSYMLLYALIPLINAGLKLISQRKHLFLLILFFFVWTVIPLTYGFYFKTQDYSPSSLGFFVFMYSLGAYLRLYPCKLFNHRFLSFLFLFITGIVMAVCRIFASIQLTFSGTINRILQMTLGFFSDESMYGPLAILFAVFAFIFIKQFDIKPNKIVYAVSGATFGVYLIHDNDWIRRVLWENIIHLKQYKFSRYFIAYIFLAIILLFCVCSLIDILRNRLLEKPVFNSSFYHKIARKCRILFNDISDRLGIGC